MLSRLAKNYELNPEKFYSIKGGEKIFKSYKQVETEALTAYATSMIGLAAGQQASSAYADYRVKHGDSQWDANRRSMWIPEVLLGIGAGVAFKYKIMNLPKLPALTLPKLNLTMPTLPKLPTGAFGFPYAAYVAGQISEGNYPLKSQFATPALSVPQIKLNLLPKIENITAVPAVSAPQVTPLPANSEEQK